MVSGRFGPEATCVPYKGADLAEQLSDAVSNIHGELTAYCLLYTSRQYDSISELYNRTCKTVVANPASW